MDSQHDPDTVIEEREAGTTLALAALSFTLSKAIVVHSDSRGGAAEALHALRTHLMARHVQAGRRSIAVCEAGPSGGAFVATNLAFSFADAGVRTLLIDANLRNPMLGQLITPSRPVTGLAEIVADRHAAIGSAIHPVTGSLSVMYAGEAGDRAQELLANHRFAQICDLCLREYDLTIAITPSANFFADARRITSVLRYALVVARKDVTFVKDLKTLIEELGGDGATVIGSVYNDF